MKVQFKTTPARLFVTKEDRITHLREAEIDAVECKRLGLGTHCLDVLNHLQRIRNSHNRIELTIALNIDAFKRD